MIADDVLVGPHAHLNGARVDEGVFVATGASIFPGAHVGAGAELRINAVVQIGSQVAPGAVVPIGWVAVGRPAQILAPDRHDEIWAVQEPLDFPSTVYGVARGTSMQAIMARQSAWFAAHFTDRVLDSP